MPAGVHFDDKLRQYIRALLTAACGPQYGGLHASAPPMYEQELADAATALAVQASRRWVTPQDIKTAAPSVLRRMVPNAEAVATILDNTPVP